MAGHSMMGTEGMESSAAARRETAGEVVSIDKGRTQKLGLSGSLLLLQWLMSEEGVVMAN